MMKKLSLCVFLVLLWCNVGFAGILDQNKYICKDESNMGRTEFSILKKYNDSYVLLSENLGFGMILVNFASIEDDHLVYFSVDGAFETVTMMHLYPPENNKRKYVSSTFGLYPDQSSIMQSNITRFNDAPDKIKTQDLTKDELNSEIEIFKNIKNVLDQILSQSEEQIQERSWGSTIYYCDIGDKIDESKSNSKPNKNLIQTMKEACIGDKKDSKNLKICNCYGDWFYENLNADQFNEFLYLSREDKIKFVEKNNIMQKCNKQNKAEEEKRKKKKKVCKMLGLSINECKKFLETGELPKIN